MLLSESVLNFRRVTGILDLGGYQSLDADNLSTAVFLSPVQTSPLLSYGHFMFFGIRMKFASFFGCAFPKHKMEGSKQLLEETLVAQRMCGD